MKHLTLWLKIELFHGNGTWKDIEDKGMETGKIIIYSIKIIFPLTLIIG